MTGKPRCLLLPAVLISERPDMVCMRQATDSETYDYLETMLHPNEARRLGLALLNDAERAEHVAGRMTG